MKLPVVLAVLIGIFVLACSTVTPAPAEPTPNIDATVEARVQGTQEVKSVIEATVQARVKQELESQPTQTPVMVEAPQVSTPLPTSNLPPTIRPFPTPTLALTTRPVPTLDAPYFYAKGISIFSEAVPGMLADKTYQEAITEFTTAIQLDPLYVDAYLARGIAYYRMLNYEESIKDYNTVIDLDPDNPKVYLNLGNTHRMQRGQHQQAIQDYGKAIQLDPYFALAYHRRARAHYEVRQYDEQVADETRACLLESQYCPKAVVTPTPTPTPIPQDGRYTMIVDPGDGGDFTGKIVRFKIGDLYAAETASWEGGGATDLSLSVESLRDSNGATTQKVPASYTPPHLFTGKASMGGNSVPLGTTISAWVDGLQVATTTTVEERPVSGMSGTGEIFSPLGNTLQMVWYLTYPLPWAFYAPDFESLGINTYSDPSDGDIVWVSMNSNQNFQNQLLYEGWNLISLENSVTTATSPAAPEPSVATSFGDGTWVIENDIQAGTYRSSKTGNSCYWERLSGFSGELDDIITNGVTDAIWVVEIASTDAGFSTERCGTWTEATSAITSSLSSPFGDGTFIVGLDIASGTWRSPGGDSCYWARLSGFSGELGHIKTNGAGGSNNILTIEPADKGFESSNCGTWTKTG